MNVRAKLLPITHPQKVTKNAKLWQRLLVMTLTTAIAMQIISCEQPVEEKIKYHSVINNFRNVKEAPKPIADAANGIVLVKNMWGSGTGFFVSPKGILVTNAHVIGPKNCPRTGCYIEIHQNYQIGSEPEDALEVFADPIVIDQPSDVAVYQLKHVDKDGTTVLADIATPNYLSLAAMKSNELLNTKAHIVGHPNGTLKKWSPGTIVEINKKMFTLDTIVIPGNSGSPVLNDAGQVIGIVHHTDYTLNTSTRAGFQGTSLATNITAFYNKLPITGPNQTNKGKDSKSLQVLEDINSADFDIIEKNNLLLAAREIPQALKTKHGKNIAQKILADLGQRCDTTLDSDFSTLTIGDVEEQLINFKIATQWMKTYATLNGFNKILAEINSSDKKLWQERFTAFTTKIQNEMGRDFLEPLIWIAQLETDKNAMLKELQRQFAGYLNTYQPKLSFRLAYLLLKAFGDQPNYTYQGQVIVDYVKNYAKQPNYQRYFTDIVEASLVLVGSKTVTIKTFIALMEEVLSSDQIKLNDFLELEAMAYAIRLV